MTVSLVISLCIGFPFLLIGALWWLYNFNFILRATETTGKIIDHKNDGSHGMIRPIVEFQGPDGKMLTFTEATGHASETSGGFLELIIILPVLIWQMFANRNKADQTIDTPEIVKVVYDPNNPSRAHIKSFWYFYGRPMILIAIGLFVGISGIPFIAALYGKIFSFLTKLIDLLPSWL